MKKNWLVFLSYSFNLIFLGFILFNLSRVDNNLVLKPISETTLFEKDIDTRNVLSGIKYKDLKKALIGVNYFESKNLSTPSDIQNDLQLLDSLYPGNYTNLRRDILLPILTDSLSGFINRKNWGNDLQKLIEIQNWYIANYYYSTSNNSNVDSKFFRLLFNYWGNYIKDTLISLANRDNIIKYNYFFKHLENRSLEYKFPVAIKVTKLEKVIANILENDWGHLFQAAWNQSSFLQKIVFLIAILITLLSYGFLILQLKKLII